MKNETNEARESIDLTTWKTEIREKTYFPASPNIL
jgi:hypothetical protein